MSFVEDSWQSFNSQGLLPWGYDSGLSLVENFRSAIEQWIFLPHQSIQLPILISIAMMPSALSASAPIVVIYGPSGSAKSTITKAVKALYNKGFGKYACQIFDSTATHAGIRNWVTGARYRGDVSGGAEANLILLLDNVEPGFFRNEQRFGAFLSGCNRSTSKLVQSDGKGETLTYDWFTTKMLTTIYPLWTYPELSQIVRRSVILRTAPIADITGPALEGRDPDEFDPDDPDVYDLTPFAHQFEEFWISQENADAFRQLLMRHQRFQKKIHGSYSGWSPERWAICKYAVIAGLFMGVFPSFPDAMHGWSQFWELTDASASSETSLKQAIDDWINRQLQLNRSNFGDMTISEGLQRWKMFKLREMQQYLQSIHQVDILYPEPKLPEIMRILSSLNWRTIRTASLDSEETSTWMYRD